MRYFHNLKHPTCYHHSNAKHFFEGWYYKISFGKNMIAIIPSISITPNGKRLYIQVISNLLKKPLTYNYPFHNFHYKHNPFQLDIGPNHFSLNKILLKMNKNFEITGDITLSDLSPVKCSLTSPSLMGPFSFIPNMECNHHVISMHHHVSGFITLNGQLYSLSGGIGYLEKDWGTSFPKNYIWMQCNQFYHHPETAMMLSIGHIPLYKLFNFQGFIACIQHQGKEYRFATYNRSKILKISRTSKKITIYLRNRSSMLVIQQPLHPKMKQDQLYAPTNGEMSRIIKEANNNTMKIKLYRKGKLILKAAGKNASLEISNAL